MNFREGRGGYDSLACSLTLKLITYNCWRQKSNKHFSSSIIVQLLMVIMWSWKIFISFMLLFHSCFKYFRCLLGSLRGHWKPQLVFELIHVCVLTHVIISSLAEEQPAVQSLSLRVKMLSSFLSYSNFTRATWRSLHNSSVTETWVWSDIPWGSLNAPYSKDQFITYGHLDTLFFMALISSLAHFLYLAKTIQLETARLAPAWLKKRLWLVCYHVCFAYYVRTVYSVEWVRLV